MGRADQLAKRIFEEETGPSTGRRVTFEVPREGRERLLRYVARPMVVGERVSELADGRIAWRRSIPGGRGDTHRIMEPMEFMARRRMQRRAVGRSHAWRASGGGA